MSIFAKITATLGACALAFAATPASAQTNVISDPVGFYKVPLNIGANMVATPLYKVQSYRGLVSGVVGNVVTFSGAPGFTNNAFGTNPTNGFAQYIAIVKNDAVPAGGTNITGDWAKITANGTNSITVDPAQGLAPLLAVGDQVEIRKLTTLADVFGAVGSSILNVDVNADQNPALSDVVKFLNGTAFARTVTYVGAGVFGVEGYYDDASGNLYDGTTFTIEPDEPFVVYRRAPATNIVVLGQVQTTPLTHYLGSGANAVSSAFPAVAPVGSSGIEQSGWLLDTTGNQNPSETDVIRPVTGTAFDTTITFMAPSGSGESTNAWYDGNVFSSQIPISPAKGYIFYVKSGTGGRVWRQTVPFTP